MSFLRHGAYLDRRALQKFIGFIEGRLRINVPRVWQMSLLRTRAYSENQIHIQDFRYWPYRDSDSGLRTPLRVFVDRSGRGIEHVSSGDKECHISEEISIPKSKDCVSALITDDHCFLAIHDSIGYSYKLHCLGLEATGGKARWTSDVFAAFYGGGTGGGYQHRVTMRQKEGKVYVFGACLMGSYIEVFSTQNGDAICRFRTETLE